MIFLFLATAQAVSSAPPEKIDLTIRQPCDSKRPANGEIVVCGRTDSSSPYRLKQPPLPQRSDIPKAEIQLTEGVSASAEAESANVGGFPSNRIMVALKLKF